jgi:glycosyltransferase involved in cell wall biosynthesis
VRALPDARSCSPARIRALSRTRGIDARGFVSDDELSSLYRNAIALVMPSLEEGFGLPARKRWRTAPR